MNDFEMTQRLDELFRSSKGQPVDWMGETVWMAYKIPVGEQFDRACITIDSFKSEPTQGICMRIHPGQLEVADQRNDGVVLWMDTAPKVVDVSLSGQSNSVLEVWNCWKGRFGERAAWLGSAGLVAEVRENHGYRFTCSDGPGLADFSALTFEIALSS